MKSRNGTPTCRPPISAAIAESIAVAAVRYFMVKFSRGKVIVFDIDEALSFEGESGPYLQYAVVRANNIFAKLKERDGTDAAAVIAAVGTTAPDILTGSSDESLDLWGLILEAARLDDVVDQAVRTLELSVLASTRSAWRRRSTAFTTATRSSKRNARMPGSGARLASRTTAFS